MNDNNLYVDPFAKPARVPLAKAALFVGACAVGGFGLGALLAAVVSKRVWDAL